MFSGLVEQTSPVLEVKAQPQCVYLIVKRPSVYNFLKEGDSLCVDGVCLTLDKLNKKTMSFGLGPETLKITGWTPAKLKNKTLNLERSITLQSAIGGHFLTGHVDGLALIRQIKKQGGSTIVQIRIPKEFKDFFWKKGYIAINGVSLTVNDVKGSDLELCLIPKTLKLTNLSSIQKGGLLNFEVDYMSRSLVNGFKALSKKLKK